MSWITCAGKTELGINLHGEKMCLLLNFSVGCLQGVKLQETNRQVFWQKILRRNQAYSYRFGIVWHIDSSSNLDRG